MEGGLERVGKLRVSQVKLGRVWRIEGAGEREGLRGILGEMTDPWLEHHSECHTHALKGCSSSQEIDKHILG